MRWCLNREEEEFRRLKGLGLGLNPEVWCLLDPAVSTMDGATYGDGTPGLHS